MPRRRVKKPPKPSHVYPTHASVTRIEDPGVPVTWAAWVDEKLGVTNGDTYPFDQAVSLAYTYTLAGIPATLTKTDPPVNADDQEPS